MKKMNIYEAPKAEMVELYAKNEIMQGGNYQTSMDNQYGD